MAGSPESAFLVLDTKNGTIAPVAIIHLLLQQPLLFCSSSPYPQFYHLSELLVNELKQHDYPRFAEFIEGLSYMVKKPPDLERIRQLA